MTRRCFRLKLGMRLGLEWTENAALRAYFQHVERVLNSEPVMEACRRNALDLLLYGRSIVDLADVARAAIDSAAPCPTDQPAAKS